MFSNTLKQLQTQIVENAPVLTYDGVSIQSIRCAFLGIFCYNNEGEYKCLD